MGVHLGGTLRLLLWGVSSEMEILKYYIPIQHHTYIYTTFLLGPLFHSLEPFQYLLPIQFSKQRSIMEQDPPRLPGHTIVPDQTYGMDFAVYPTTDRPHSHSIALIKRISNEPLRELQKWLKVCHSVKKELWVLKNDLIYPMKLSHMEPLPKDNLNKFQLNKTDIAKLGFDLSSEKPLYHNFISPYEEDQQRPHPLITEIPEGFTTFDFQFDKINNRLVEDSFIYIFYNIIDERLQLQAGRNLMNKGLNYHKRYKIWVRKKDNKFEYFNINEWKYMDFNEEVVNDDYYTKEDFAERPSD